MSDSTLHSMKQVGWKLFDKTIAAISLNLYVLVDNTMKRSHSFLSPTDLDMFLIKL